jgi:putative ABC transport system permease protein
MKFLGYVLRNARRSPVRSLLTIGSTTMSLFLMMMLFSFLDMQDSVASSLRIYNRLVVMSSQGFAQPVPISRVNEISVMDGVDCITTFSWFGGKYNNETMPFAQFGVTPETMFTIYDELKVDRDQLKAFQDEKRACVIGRKLADERKINLGDKLPLQGDGYPFNLDLVVRGIYDGPAKSDLRTCYFHWDYLNEEFKKVASASKMVDNAGIVIIKCTSADKMTPLKQKIDSSFANSDTPTRTQTEEAFNNMFAGMIGDLKGMIRWIGIAVVCSLIFVAGNAMAMALRERTTEVAVLKAIGFSRGLVINLVLAEAVLVSLIGGLLGTLGSKAYFDVVDISKFVPKFLPFFFVPWRTALIGIAVSLGIGLVSGFVPAVRAAQLSVVNGLRKVV